jgi:hypothetical protein
MQIQGFGKNNRIWRPWIKETSTNINTMIKNVKKIMKININRSLLGLICTLLCYFTARIIKVG